MKHLLYVGMLAVSSMQLCSVQTMTARPCCAEKYSGLEMQSDSRKRKRSILPRVIATEETRLPK
jgi:hypothetical protein